jgi:hypothetical protein
MSPALKALAMGDLPDDSTKITKAKPVNAMSAT